MTKGATLQCRRLDNRAAAQYLGVSESFLNKSRISGTTPPYIKAGAKVLYDLADLDAWLAQRRRASTSEPAPSSALAARP